MYNSSYIYINTSNVTLAEISWKLGNMDSVYLTDSLKLAHSILNNDSVLLQNIIIKSEEF